MRTSVHSNERYVDKEAHNMSSGGRRRSRRFSLDDSKLVRSIKNSTPVKGFVRGVSARRIQNTRDADNECEMLGELAVDFPTGGRARFVSSQKPETVSSPKPIDTSTSTSSICCSSFEDQPPSIDYDNTVEIPQEKSNAYSYENDMNDELDLEFDLYYRSLLQDEAGYTSYFAPTKFDDTDIDIHDDDDESNLTQYQKRDLKYAASKNSKSSSFDEISEKSSKIWKKSSNSIPRRRSLPSLLLTKERGQELLYGRKKETKTFKKVASCVNFMFHDI